MRTLKKTLCLVLALALCFSLASVAFASNLDSYTDAESVTYTEAVDVLMGIGVVKGDTETTINPQGDLTREQAAKLVAYVAVGGNVADKLSADSAPFDDVAATRWSAGYISYCVTAGIINGDGNGKFRPTDNVTGYEFAKMMLCVLGYGKNNEYTGKGWSVNVAKDALSTSINLFKDVLDAASNEPINREEAFQVVFNTITIPQTVVFSKDTESYKDADEKADNTIAKTVYGLEKVTEDVTDANGRTGYKWQANGKDVSDIYTGVAAFTFTSAQTEEALKKTLKGYTFGEISEDAAALAKLTGNGVLVEVYADADKNITGVVTVEEKLDTVSKVTPADAAKETKRTITVDGKTFETESFAEKDYVLYTENGGKIVSVIAAPSVQGKITATGTGYIRVDGTKYEFAANATDAVKALAEFKGTYTFYLDSYGYIVDAVVVEAGEVALNYVYVADSLGTNKTGTSFASADISAKLSIVNLDGTTAIVDYATTVATAAKDDVYAKGDTVYTKPDGTVAKVPNGSTLVDAGFYSYTVNSDGAYTLKALDATKAAAVASRSAITVAKGKAAVEGIDSKVANSKTVLTLTKNGAATTYTGIANFPSETFTVGTEKGNVTGILYTFANGVIDQIIVLDGSVTVAADPAVYAVYLGAGETSAAGTVQNFLLSDGSKKEYTVSDEHPATISAEAGEVVTLTVTSGYLTEAAKVTPTEAGTVTILDDTFFVAGSTYYYASSYTIFDLTDTENPTVATSIKKDDKVSYVKVGGEGTDKDQVALLVITK